MKITMFMVRVVMKIAMLILAACATLLRTPLLRVLSSPLGQGRCHWRVQ